MEINRNLKTLDNKTGKKIVSKLNEMLRNHDRYKNSYFWRNTGNAASRRSQEFTESICFTLNGKKYLWEQELSISCKNFYWSSSVYVDDKKSNITAINRITKQVKK